MNTKVLFSTAWADFWRQGQSFLLRPRCALCERTANDIFCEYCARSLADCRRAKPHSNPLGLPPLSCWGYYEGSLKQSIARLKYDQQIQAAVPFGTWLSELWSLKKTLPLSSYVVVPIPLHRERQQQRGFNQAELIAKSFCQSTGLPLKAHGLVRARPTVAQHGLSAVARQQNLRDAFKIGADLRGLPQTAQVILIDDIFTTGATFKAAVETLHAKGFKTAALMTVAGAQND
jgi:ComF family protein